jgi:hypothetical protein
VRGFGALGRLPLGFQLGCYQAFCLLALGLLPLGLDACRLSSRGFLLLGFNARGLDPLGFNARGLGLRQLGAAHFELGGIALHVLAPNPPADPTTGHIAQVNLQLSRQFAHQRRDVSHSRRRRPRRWRSRSSRRCRRRTNNMIPTTPGSTGKLRPGVRSTRRAGIRLG